MLEKNNVTNTKIKAFVGGGCASIVGQTIIVPFDVISQHMMLVGHEENRNVKNEVKNHPCSSNLVKNTATMHTGSSGVSSAGCNNSSKC